MVEQNLIERLDDAVEAILAGRGQRVSAEESDLVTLVDIAADLRDLPDPHFKAMLQWKVVPRTRRTITTHFRVDGVDAFIAFLEQAFGGKEEFRTPPRPDGGVSHAQVRIGDSIVEMGDATAESRPYAFGVHLYVEDVDAVYQQAVHAGATSMYPPVNQFYGDREATVKDRFGNQWYIATRQETGQPVPQGFRTITPFLHPRGAERMIEFLRQAFGAETIEEPDRSPDGKIAHAAMRIGDSLIEMGEAHGEWQPMEAGIHLYVDDADAVYRRAVEAGATTVYPPTNAPYGERAAYVVDPFGNHWYIGTPTG
jgi:PhnB protein